MSTVSILAEKAHTRQQGILRDGIWIKSKPSCYSPSQIAEYLSRIEFPTSYTVDQISQGSFSVTMDNLRLLITHHLLTFPFENTAIHYTAEHAIDISPEGAFKRFVIEGKGSYCFGQNSMFLRILRGLRYRCYGGSARVKFGTIDAPIYSSHGHMVIFVQPFSDSNQTYVIDVGFGLLGLTRPILLSDAENNIVNGMDPTEKHRLMRESMPNSSLSRDQHSTTKAGFLWSLQLFQELDSVDPKDRYWRTLYTFSEEEFFEMDYEDASYVSCTKPGSLFVKNILVTKHFLVDDDEAMDEGGAETQMSRIIMFGNDVKKLTGGTSVKLMTLTTELERLKVLRDIFGIDIDDKAAEYIIGLPSAL